MRETQVWSPVWEDPTCHRATKPVSHVLSLCSRAKSHNYWSPCIVNPMLHNKRSPCIATQSSPCSWQLEKNLHSNEDPAQPKINKMFKNLKIFNMLLLSIIINVTIYYYWIHNFHFLRIVNNIVILPWGGKKESIGAEQSQELRQISSMGCVCFAGRW